MDNSTVFTPVRGYDRNIQAMDYQDGFLYFAIDTKKIYLDAKGQNKIPIGGGGGEGGVASQKARAHYVL